MKVDRTKGVEKTAERSELDIQPLLAKAHKRNRRSIEYACLDGWQVKRPWHRLSAFFLLWK
jgi:hypothetical protein